MSSKKQAPEPASPLLRWTSHPLVDYPRTSIILAVFLVCLAGLLWQITVVEWHMPLFYVLGMLFVLGSLLTWFIPTTYTLLPDRIEANYLAMPMRRSWSDFRCYYVDKKGVMLGTFPHPTRLDRFRGMSVRFSKKREEQEALLNILNEKIGKRA